MKIGFVYDAIYPYVKGGGEKRIWEFSLRLVSKGHEVHLYGLKYWEGSACIRKDGIFLHGVSPSVSLYSGSRRSIPEALIFGAGVLPHIIKERLDLVDCQQFPYFSGISSKIGLYFRQTPLIITWYEIWGNYWYNYLGYWGCAGKFMDQVMSRLTPYHIAISDAVKEDFSKSFPGRDIQVISYPIDLPHIRGIPPSEMRSDIIFAGRFIREKNISLLIEAIDIIRKIRPEITCLLVGDGPEIKNLMQKVKDQDLEKNIRFTGFIDKHDDVIALMKSSKVFAFPSIREGYGIVVLEAMACGLPVITTDHKMNASRFFINPGTGFLSSLSPEEFSRKIIRALDNFESLTSNCLRYSSTYNWDDVCLRLEKYYSYVIEDSTRR